MRKRTWRSTEAAQGHGTRERQGQNSNPGWFRPEPLASFRQKRSNFSKASTFLSSAPNYFGHPLLGHSRVDPVNEQPRKSGGLDFHCPVTQLPGSQNHRVSENLFPASLSLLLHRPSLEWLTQMEELIPLNCALFDPNLLPAATLKSKGPKSEQGRERG